MNDPLLNRRGARAGVTLALAPWAEVGMAFAWYPVLGPGGANDPDWKPLLKQLVLESSVWPDHARLVWQWQAVARVHALQLPLGERWRAHVGLLGGVALSEAERDLLCLQCMMLPEPEHHVGPVLGVFWDLRWRGVTIRVRYEHLVYVEAYGDRYLERKDNAVAGVEVVGWLR